MKLNLEDIKAFLIKNKTYVIIAVLFVVMVVTLVRVSSMNSSEETAETKSEEVIKVDETTSEEPSETTEATTAAANELQVDVYPAVNELVNKYFTAMANGDIDTLLQIVNPLSEEAQTQVLQKKEYIEGYNNIKCYTKIGPEENSYIAFIYYEIKLNNINTLVPGEIPKYICSNEDGSLYIYEGELSPEVKSYIEGIVAGQDVVDLVSSIDAKFTEAQESDPDLKEFIEKLAGTTEEVADATAEEQPAEEQPAEEQPAEEQAAEEQPAEEQTAEAATENGVEEVDETIYAAETVNVRESDNEEASRLGQLYVGESAKRTGILSNGWSRIEFNGQTGYVLTECLTNQGALQETKYLTSTVNIREKADENSSRVGTGYLGAKVTRTAKLDSGWSRINCDGIIGYVKSEYLADTYN
jgi:uncharacterized protein YgiM (DUF1202 family)